MSNTPFIALETENGIVRGKIYGGGWFGSSELELTGKKITDALNKCAEHGYEHFDTDTIGDKKIYRLKLRTSLNT
jgi:hypothetical protein